MISGLGESGRDASLDVGAGAGIGTHAGEHDPPQRMVGLAVAAAVESMPVGLLPGRGGQAVRHRTGSPTRPRNGHDPRCRRRRPTRSRQCRSRHRRGRGDWPRSCAPAARASSSSRAAAASRSMTWRPKVRNASFVASTTGSPPAVGRNVAAVCARRLRGTPRNRSRSSSGAVNPRWRIWFKHLMRVSCPERFAISSVRIASTLPSADFAIPNARPDTTARAASIASIASDFPTRRRNCRFGRSTSSTSTPRPRRKRARPAPYAPVPSTPTRCTGPNPASHSHNAPNPRGVVANDATPNTPPFPSTAAATCTSACVSTPPVTGRVVSTMVIAIPSLLNGSRGGTHVPRRRPCRARCSNSELGHPPERGVPNSNATTAKVPAPTTTRWTPTTYSLADMAVRGRPPQASTKRLSRFAVAATAVAE